MTDKIRIGIVGMGNIGTQYADLIQHKISGGILTAVCNRSTGPLEAYAHLKTFTDSQELIRSGTVDALIITTPHYAHVPIGIDALEQGLHVLVDKPLAAHIAGARQLLDAHTDPQLVFGILFNQRTNPTYKKARELIQEGALGDLIRINWMITDWFRTDIYFDSPWKGTWAGEGGGVLLNQAPHQLDLLQWIMGMPQKVRGFCRLGAHTPIEVEDDVTAYFEYAHGTTGIFITSTGEAPGTNRLEISGDQGRILIEKDAPCTFTRNKISLREFRKTATDGFAQPETEVTALPSGDSGGQHTEVIQNFIDAIQNGTPLIAPAQEGYHSLELANAILYSSLKEQPIHLPLDAAAYQAILLDCGAS